MGMWFIQTWRVGMRYCQWTLPYSGLVGQYDVVDRAKLGMPSTVQCSHPILVYSVACNPFPANQSTHNIQKVVTAVLPALLQIGPTAVPTVRPTEPLTARKHSQHVPTTTTARLQARDAGRNIVDFVVVVVAFGAKKEGLEFGGRRRRRHCFVWSVFFGGREYSRFFLCRLVITNPLA